MWRWGWENSGWGVLCELEDEEISGWGVICEWEDEEISGWGVLCEGEDERGMDEVYYVKERRRHSRWGTIQIR